MKIIGPPYSGKLNVRWDGKGMIYSSDNGLRNHSFTLDMVICCQYKEDAKRIRNALDKRLAKFNLKLNKEKTKIVPFSKREAARGKSQKSFDFLGFTFYLGRSKKGRIIPKVKTSGKKLRTKLKNVNEWSRAVRNRMKLAEIWKLFQAKIRGHIQYYGVSHNTAKVNEFINQAKRILFKWLNRRSQKKSFDWDKFNKFILRYPLPKSRVVHNLF